MQQWLRRIRPRISGQKLYLALGRAGAERRLPTWSCLIIVLYGSLGAHLPLSVFWNFTDAVIIVRRHVRVHAIATAYVAGELIIPNSGAL